MEIVNNWGLFWQILPGFWLRSESTTSLTDLQNIPLSEITPAFTTLLFSVDADLASQHWEAAVTCWHIAQAWVLCEGLGNRGRCYLPDFIFHIRSEQRALNSKAERLRDKCCHRRHYHKFVFFIPSYILSVLSCFEKVVPKWLEPSIDFSGWEWNSVSAVQCLLKKIMSRRGWHQHVSLLTSVPWGLWEMVT